MLMLLADQGPPPWQPEVSSLDHGNAGVLLYHCAPYLLYPIALACRCMTQTLLGAGWGPVQRLGTCLVSRQAPGSTWSPEARLTQTRRTKTPSCATSSLLGSSIAAWRSGALLPQ